MDTSYEDIGRIPKRAAFASSIVLYVIAVVAAALRGFVRWHYGQLRPLDDGFVLLAVACLTGSFALWMTYMEKVYIGEALIYEPFKYLGSFTDILDIVIELQVFSTVFVVISLTGIYAIKFSFLCFFRQLIDRIHGLQMYWRCTLVYTAVVWIISICIVPASCPYFDSRAVQCAQGPYYHRALTVSILLSVFDVTSDLLLVSIPIILIRKIKIPFKSKVYLASSLCVSVVMMAVAILQGSTITYGSTEAIDIVWALYFQFIEATLAILVVSLTAFRTLFVGYRERNPRPSTGTPSRKKWYSNDSARKVWKKMSTRSTSDTEGTAWSMETPLSRGPLPTMIQPERTYVSPRIMSARETVRSQPPNEEGRFDSHYGASVRDISRATMADHSTLEPGPSSAYGAPVSEISVAHSIVQTREPNTNPPGVGNAKSRSQISAERRISYWQKVLASGIERASTVLSGYPSRSQSAGRAETIMSGYRSRSLSSVDRNSPVRHASARTSNREVSPLGTSPERPSALETV